MPLLLNVPKGFFEWKKILVRSTHLILVLFIAGNLLMNDTKLRSALVSRDYVYVSCFASLIYASLLFYFLTCLSDPGFVDVNSANICANTPSTNEEDIIAAKIQFRHCDYCQIDQPLRSRHCEECKRCVCKFDHHCPWLETCIGEKNHRFFWLFLGSTIASILWCITITVQAFRHYSSWLEWIKYNMFYLFNMQVLVIALAVTSALFLIHTHFMFTNTTTWERFSRKNITYLKIINDDTYNPFAQSYCRNCWQFLCSRGQNRWEKMYISYIKNTFSNHEETAEIVIQRDQPKQSD